MVKKINVDCRWTESPVIQVNWKEKSGAVTCKSTPANGFAQGVPAVLVQENITDADRETYFGLIPEKWAKYEGDALEARIKKGTA